MAEDRPICLSSDEDNEDDEEEEVAKSLRGRKFKAFLSEGSLALHPHAACNSLVLALPVYQLATGFEKVAVTSFLLWL